MSAARRWLLMALVGLGGVVAAGPARPTPVEMWRSGDIGGRIPSTHSLMSPIVIPWTDDNGDGIIDERDGGDVLFVGTNIDVSGDGVLRLLEGRTGADIRVFEEALSGAPAPWHVCAAGDVDADGFPEVVCGQGGNRAMTGLLMFNWDGSLRWQTSPLDLDTYTAPQSITLIDLDGDGQSEILVSRTILNNEGQLIRRLDIPPCREAVPVDIDLDGSFEIACGPNVARQDGTRVWSWDAGHMISAPAQLDADPMPEFLGTNWGDDTVRAWDDDGTLLWREDTMWRTQVRSVCHAVADVNFDGRSEVYLGEGDSTRPDVRRVVAYDHLGEVIWEAPSMDLGVGGGSIAWMAGGPTFLHEDYQDFVAYDARDGSELFRLANRTGTAWEAPVFADLDGDGIGELLTSSTDDALPGIRAWRDPSWCPARAVFNQHAYVPDYIGSDLRPSGPPATPIDWAKTGMRQQRNDCPCPGAPAVTPSFSAPCSPGETCVRVDVSPRRHPFALEMTLPDGSTTSSPEACFPSGENQSIRVVASDGANCAVDEVFPVPVLPERAATIQPFVPDCSRLDIQCSRALLVGMEAPVILSWILPDGTPSSDEQPCFLVTAPGVVQLTATDALGCVVAARLDVEPPAPLVLQELSATAATALRVTRVGSVVRITWQSSPSGLPMALFGGEIGTWWSHAPLLCTTIAEAEDASLSPATYYLAGESGCAGEAGPLGVASDGTERPRPDTTCP